MGIDGERLFCLFYHARVVWDLPGTEELRRMSEPASPLGENEQAHNADPTEATPARGAEVGAAAAKLRRRLVRKHRAQRRGRKRNTLVMALALGLVVISATLAALFAYVYWVQPKANREVVAPAGTFVAPLAQALRADTVQSE